MSAPGYTLNAPVYLPITCSFFLFSSSLFFFLCFYLAQIDQFFCISFQRICVFFQSSVILFLLQWSQWLVFHLQLHRFVNILAFTEPEDQIITFFQTLRSHPRFFVSLCQLICPLFYILCFLKLFQCTDLLIDRSSSRISTNDILKYTDSDPLVQPVRTHHNSRLLLPDFLSLSQECTSDIISFYFPLFCDKQPLEHQNFSGKSRIFSYILLTFNSMFTFLTRFQSILSAISAALLYAPFSISFSICSVFNLYSYLSTMLTSLYLICILRILLFYCPVCSSLPYDSRNVKKMHPQLTLKMHFILYLNFSYFIL